MDNKKDVYIEDTGVVYVSRGSLILFLIIATLVISVYIFLFSLTF